MPLSEAEPEDLGLNPAKLERACALIEEHIAQGFHPGAQFAVARRGRLAVSRCFGQASVEPSRPADPHSLFLMYSNTKVITAAVVWTLVEDGRLGFADTIAKHVPGFEAHGKGGITVTDLLTHQAGFPNAAVPPECWTDHGLLRRVVCDFRPEWPAGAKVHYHRGAAHWVAGVLIEAVTGQDYREAIRTRIIDKLGLGDALFVGLPQDQQLRAATMYESAGNGRWQPLQPEASSEFKLAGSPAAGGYGAARAMALFYQMLAQGGTLRGTRLLSPRLVEYVTRDFTGDRVDEFMRVPMHRGLGPFSRGQTLEVRGLGTIAHPRTFGHGGVGSSYCWADPISGVSCAFLSNCRQDDDWHNERMELISNLVHASIVD